MNQSKSNSGGYSDFILTEEYYTNLTEFINRLKELKLSLAYQRKKKGGYYVYNVPCAFDIETSSFYVDGAKQVCMYVWQFCFNGLVMVGRTWNDFLRLLETLHNTFSLSEEKRLYVYVHNLAYEFQFIRKWLEWENIFATEIRKPIKALCTYGIEFRDSLILSGYSLEMTAKQLHTYKVKKQVGLLDYTKIRTSKTPLTHDEILYCIYDVIVVSAYIMEQIEEYGKITRIPLTNTGRVRNFCREKCFYGFSKDKQVREYNRYEYMELMKRLQLTPDEYKIWKESFQGGFTHANCSHVGETLHNVGSFDFTSSYPYVMLSEKFPMGKGFSVEIKSIEDFAKYKDKFFMLFYVKMVGVSPRLVSDNPISYSRCLKCENPILNNGRVVYADELVIACNNVDLGVYVNFYNVEHIEISKCYCYAKDYLPRNFILSILKLYNDKTKLKGVAGSEREYMHSKSMLNSCFGMCVTDIVRDESIYTDEWESQPADIEEAIDHYNTNRNRFLFYPWGCAVTSYARKNLFSAIAECGNDYCYSDTDSVKILNRKAHEEYFRTYNEEVERKLKVTAEHYKIPFEYFKPKTVKGVEKMIGVWDYEGEYDTFKTLGAKRYIFRKDGELTSTVAGVSKTGLSKYLIDAYGNDDEQIFEHFSNQLHIPEDYTGKLVHTYIDSEMKGTIVDYKGDESSYYEKSGVHLSKTDYLLSMSQLFIDFLKGVHVESEI